MNTYRFLRYFCHAVFVTAITIFSCSASADTKSSDILEQAKIANENFDFEEAFDLTIQAYDENDENPDMWLQMGIALQGMDKYSDAISCFEKAILYAGNRKEILSDAYLNLGTLYMEQNLPEKGIQAVNKGLEIDKDNWHLLALRAHLLYNFDKKQAKKDLSQAEKLAPKDPYLFLEEAFMYFEAEEYADALKAIDKAMDLGGNEPVFYFAKGNIQEKMRNLNGAANSYLESILIGDFNYIPPFTSLFNQVGKKQRQIVLDAIKHHSLNYPKLNGILYVLLDRWNEDGADEIYNELVKVNDKDANHYFRVAKAIVERIPDNTARGVVNFDATDNTARGVVVQEDENKSDQIFVAVEQPAEFPGGLKALMDWLVQNIRYPQDAQDEGVQGKSLLKFIVEKDGSISNVEIIKRNDPSLDAEAIRVVRSMPMWEPGMNQGTPVRSYFTLPVSFRLNN